VLVGAKLGTVSGGETSACTRDKKLFSGRVRGSEEELPWYKGGKRYLLITAIVGQKPTDSG